ncbi:MAG TPA: hypothetical protein VKE40_07635 [Gemmataceae bacterium]|nr:hypothetical protein [Gemmataceae bacterium]
MKRVLAFVVVLVGSAAAHAADPPKESTKFDDLKDMLTALGKAEKADVVLREGLPHPVNERKAFEAEKKKETIESAGALFYKEPLTLKADDTTTVLARLLDATSYADFRGEKKCGGFHPDYEVVVINTADKSEYRFQVCFGCHEVKVYGPKDQAVRADLTNGYDALAKVLRPYQKNRPESKE